MANTTYMKLEQLPYTIETQRLHLRSYDPRNDQHTVDLWNAIDGNRDHLMRFMTWAKNHTNIDITRAWIREARSKFEAMTDFSYGIWTKDDGRMVGGCGLHVRGEPMPNGLEIGYWLCEREQRKGFAREATIFLTRVAFEIAKADRVVIRADVDNRESRRVPEAIGFTFEGIARKSLRAGDIARDAAIYAMTSDDPSESLFARAAKATKKPV